VPKVASHAAAAFLAFHPINELFVILDDREKEG
jgi:hypothetical protein